MILRRVKKPYTLCHPGFNLGAIVNLRYAQWIPDKTSFFRDDTQAV